MKKREVKQMLTKAGKPAQGQFIVERSFCSEYFSDGRKIVMNIFIPRGNGEWEVNVFLDKKYYKSSRKIIIYRNKFLDLKSREVENYIRRGIFELRKLNRQ